VGEQSPGSCTRVYPEPGADVAPGVLERLERSPPGRRIPRLHRAPGARSDHRGLQIFQQRSRSTFSGGSRTARPLTSLESVRPGDYYGARDLLARDQLQVSTSLDSLTLSPGVIVLARFAPVWANDRYGALGPLVEVPAPIWPRFKAFVQGLRMGQT
jgi:hypothetical protein